MTWLAWRQFRGSAFAALIALIGVGSYLTLFGSSLREKHEDVLATCGSEVECNANLAQFAASYENPLLLIAAATYVVPIILGMFWGAPLIAAELEQRTHKLAWNQSVTRRRWLFTKIGFAVGGAVVASAIVSGILTWASAPVDEIAKNRFDTVTFGARHVAPIAYSMFAVALGTLMGAATKKRLPAMALTAVVFIFFQFMVPNFVRPHLMPAKTETREMTVEAINDARSLGSITGAPAIGGLRVPGAWVSDTSLLLTRKGVPLPTSKFDTCFSDPPDAGASGTFGDTAVCLARLNTHVELTYHPNSRYWTFQVMELALYALASLIAALVSLQLVRRSNG